MVAAHQTKLHQVAYRLAGSRSDADDVVQETLERAWRYMGRFESGQNDLGWLLRILHNAFIDQCRRRAREATPIERPDELPETVDDSPTDPEGWRKITPVQFRDAVARLPEPFRTAYEMFAFRRLSYEAIAAELAIPKDTVGTRLIRARRKLREILSVLLSPEGP
jgi:RNA polymerase sigma-70 factor, ECF subfamily